MEHVASAYGRSAFQSGLKIEGSAGEPRQQGRPVAEARQERRAKRNGLMRVAVCDAHQPSSQVRNGFVDCFYQVGKIGSVNAPFLIWA